jgi:lycopene beta-cyclase
LWLTETSEGGIVSDFVIDTRPAQSVSSTPPVLWQAFVGYELESQTDSFDQSTAQLMNFLETDSKEIEFLYVLPTTRRRALVELTVISPDRPSFEDLAQRLERQLKEKFGDQRPNVIRREQGAIPMGIDDALGFARSSEPSDSSYVHVGVAAGSARPSSGYTFCRIQRWATECANSLQAGGKPIGPLADTSLVKFMDSVFLKVLRRHPQLAPELFMGMFRKVPSRRLLRFLGDSPTLMDAMFLVAALPKLPFLREVIRPTKETSRMSSEATCLP